MFPVSYPLYAPEFTSVVTLFFVISGFTLTCVYNQPLHEKEGGAAPESPSHPSPYRPIPLRPFLVKRLARLAPVYYFSLLFSLPIFIEYNRHTPEHQMVWCIIPTLLGIQSLVVPYVGWNLPVWQVSGSPWPPQR